MGVREDYFKKERKKPFKKIQKPEEKMSTFSKKFRTKKKKKQEIESVFLFFRYFKCLSLDGEKGVLRLEMKIDVQIN